MKPIIPEPRDGNVAIVFAKDQPEYLPLPANFDGKCVETKWQLSWWEWCGVLLSRNFYLSVATFGNPLQPIRLSVLRDPERRVGR
jgi:hypothetical protein